MAGLALRLSYKGYLMNASNDEINDKVTTDTPATSLRETQLGVQFAMRRIQRAREIELKSMQVDIWFSKLGLIAYR